MVPPTQLSLSRALGDVAITISGADVAFWHVGAGPDDTGLGAAVRHVLGDSELIPTDHDARPLELVVGDAAELFPTPVDAVSVPVEAIAHGFRGRERNEQWSPSVSWLHELTTLAERTVRSGRIFPTVRPHGLRWSASWTVIADPLLEAHIDRLVRHGPPVVFAASTDARTVQVRELLGAVADAIARTDLVARGWRAPLARSRSATVVALRRIIAALTSPDAVFIGDSPAHEMAFAEWSTASSEASSVMAGGPEVRFRGRLIPPSTDELTSPWMLAFDVVGVDGAVATFHEVWEGRGNATAVADDEEIGSLRLRMTELIERLTGQFALFEALLDESHPTEIALTIDEVGELLEGSLAAARRAGLSIELPPNLKQRRARLTARARSEDVAPSGRSGSGLISVDWGVALGDLDLSDEELQALAESKAEIVALRGDWIQVDRSQLGDIVDSQNERRRDSAELSAAELLREQITAFEDPQDGMSAEGWIARLLDGLPDDQLTEANEPPGFVGLLRPYQRRALGWLQFLGRIGLGGCLADDMGLGKTPTALAHLLERTLDMVDEERPHRPHLVICPLSVVSNWAAESARFTPELSVLIAHGPSRAQGDELIEQVTKHDLVITTYGTAPRVAEELAAVEWDVVVFDEAQAIKNHTTNAARSVREFRAAQKIALTGTPVENRLSELWAILDALNPGMLGGITWFRSALATPIESTGDPDKIEALKGITSPFVLRRSKADRSLVPDLPDKIEQVAWATLTPEQAGLYQAVVDDFFAQLTAATGMERRGLVLATLTKLKQVCNHPAQFLREDDLGDGRSGKLDRFDELLGNMLEAGERALVFTQYRQMGLLLASHLERRHALDAPFLHGGTPRGQRDAMVDTFQSSDGPPVQLISLRAGGTGLNLTGASRVIHYDRWWNPAVEDQATDRTWRIGQTQTVFVHKLVCQGTLEDRIDAMLTEKRALADAVVGTGDQWLTELSTDELRTLVRLDAELASES